MLPIPEDMTEVPVLLPAAGLSPSTEEPRTTTVADLITAATVATTTPFVPKESGRWSGVKKEL